MIVEEGEMCVGRMHKKRKMEDDDRV